MLRPASRYPVGSSYVYDHYYHLEADGDEGGDRDYRRGDARARCYAWVRAGKYENRSKAVAAALELLERRNARPTLEWALAHPLLEPGSPEWEAAQRESDAIDAFADALDASSPP